ncbi:hypothetical protein H0A36_22820 [Endozoicomonas sp. SM1973]|uniref:Uncharacterized protein n=1 Tax=Spartinivicinus marinus TaxID=2994442 RepID=A0A853IM52_9GAMM|nr:hypothetical protein [Spartinivicinus marinus]MCX4025874.1 hypothetical protein [Spartinivicinus marinus]NYZ68856.1 hypothetical protein [Spartinivicinus marinus]
MLRKIIFSVGFVFIAIQMSVGQAIAGHNCTLSSQASARLIVMFKTLQDRQSPQTLDYVAGMVGQQQLQIIRPFQEKGLIICVAASNEAELEDTISSLQQLHYIKYVEVDQLMKPVKPSTLGIK